MVLRQSLVVLVVTSALVGCAVGPDYKKPNVTLTDHYLAAAQVEQRSAIYDAHLDTWWEGFNDPLLTRFVTIAFNQNLDLAQASARISQARSGLRMAHVALLPSGNLSASAARNHQSLETPLGQLLNATPGYDRNGRQYEANMSASWEMDLFGELRRDQEAAMAEYQASEAGKNATRLAVAAKTADVYILIRGLQNRIAIAQHQVETQQKLETLVELLHSRGLAPTRELDQAKGTRAQIQATIPALEASLEEAMNALDVMLGVPPGTYRNALATVQNIPSSPQITTMGTPSDLLRRRPDLIMAERRLAASNARIGAAVAEYYPKFSITALIGTATALSSGNMFSSAANQATGVLGLRWRLFDFGRINAQIDLAKGQEAEAMAAYRQAALRATEDVENALSSLIKREEQTSLLMQSETSLSQARDSSFVAYQKGAVSLIEVLHADENLLRTSDAKAQAQTEAARSAIAAFKALGGGWEAGNASSSSNTLSMNAQ
jgi:NodT family efflux transporter outer membrane factor (OMF) lipoprotein